MPIAAPSRLDRACSAAGASRAESILSNYPICGVKWAFFFLPALKPGWYVLDWKKASALG
jgi:hypothetical protein